MGVSGVGVRPARADDYDDVVAFAEGTWADRGRSDYIPRIYHDWIEGPDGGDRQRTLVGTADGDVVGDRKSVV